MLSEQVWGLATGCGECWVGWARAQASSTSSQAGSNILIILIIPILILLQHAGAKGPPCSQPAGGRERARGSLVPH